MILTAEEKAVLDHDCNFGWQDWVTKAEASEANRIEKTGDTQRWTGWAERSMKAKVARLTPLYDAAKDAPGYQTAKQKYDATQETKAVIQTRAVAHNEKIAKEQADEIVAEVAKQLAAQ